LSSLPQTLFVEQLLAFRRQNEKRRPILLVDAFVISERGTSSCRAFFNQVVA
jgi:hypothetical protein